MTDALETQVDLEYQQFCLLMPEWAVYESDENKQKLADFLVQSQAPGLSAGALMGAFAVLRKQGALAIVEDPEVVKQREEQARIAAEKAERKAQLERENNRQAPLTHVSHRVLDQQATNAEQEKRDKVAAAKKIMDQIRKRITDPGIPTTIYFDMMSDGVTPHPLQGKINHTATDMAREKYYKERGQ